MATTYQFLVNSFRRTRALITPIRLARFAPHDFWDLLDLVPARVSQVVAALPGPEEVCWAASLTVRAAIRAAQDAQVQAGQYASAFHSTVRMYSTRWDLHNVLPQLYVIAEPMLVGVATFSTVYLGTNYALSELLPTGAFMFFDLIYGVILRDPWRSSGVTKFCVSIFTASFWTTLAVVGHRITKVRYELEGPSRLNRDHSDPDPLEEALPPSPADPLAHYPWAERQVVLDERRKIVPHPAALRCLNDAQAKLAIGLGVKDSILAKEAAALLASKVARGPVPQGGGEAPAVVRMDGSPVYRNAPACPAPVPAEPLPQPGRPALAIERPLSRKEKRQAATRGDSHPGASTSAAANSPAAGPVPPPPPPLRSTPFGSAYLLRRPDPVPVAHPTNWTAAQIAWAASPRKQRMTRFMKWVARQVRTARGGYSLEFSSPNNTMIRREVKAMLLERHVRPKDVAEMMESIVASVFTPDIAEEQALTQLENDRLLAMHPIMATLWLYSNRMSPFATNVANVAQRFRSLCGMGF